MKINIQTKLFLLLAGITTGVLLVVLLVINSVATNQFTQAVVSGFEQTDHFIRSLNRMRHKKLLDNASLLQVNKSLKRELQQQDTDSLRGVVRKHFSMLNDVNMVVITDRRGEVLYWSGRASAVGDSLANRTGIKRALEGQKPSSRINIPPVWTVDGRIYQTVTVPVFLRQSPKQVIGTLTVGTRFTDQIAKEIVSGQKADITFFLNHRPVAGSAKNISAEKWKNFFNHNEHQLNSLRASPGHENPAIIQLAGKERIIYAGVLGRGANASYIVNVPKEQKLGILSSIRTNILIIGLTALLALVPLAIFLGKMFANPIQKLSTAMERVRNGNLDVEVSPVTQDEVGSLARSFNQMMRYIRERFELKKHVGIHTLEKVKEKSSREVPLLENIQEMAILITDIRDSTATMKQEELKKYIKKLNETMNYQARFVSDYEGAVDKFKGDSMVAIFWGDNALKKAVNCSVAIQQKFAERKAADPFFKGIGIGINYGEMLWGKIGNHKRIDYTVVGEEVNLCSRLCSVAAAGQILIPGSVLQDKLLDSKYDIREIARDRFKGFPSAFRVMEISYQKPSTIEKGHGL